MAFQRLSRHSRLGNHGAPSGARRITPDSAPSSSPISSLFIDQLVPLNWAAQIQVFGSVADYWPDGDSDQSVTINLVWKDGAADEELSPGRYSHALINNADLPRPPKAGDVIHRSGSLYSVVRVNAYTYGIGTVILQDFTD